MFRPTQQATFNAIALCLTIGAADIVLARPWTDRTGRQFEGDYLSSKDGQVSIERASDRKVFSIPLERLSDVDQGYVKAAMAGAELIEGGGKFTYDANGHANSLVWLPDEKGYTESRLDCLSRLSKLESLLIGNLSLTDESLKKISQLNELRKLHVATQGVTDDGLKHLQPLSKLEELHLSWTKVTGPGLVHLKPLQNLKRLDFFYELQGSSLNDDGFTRHLKGDLVARVVFGNKEIKDKGLEHLADLPSLVELNLSCTEVNDEGVAHIRKLPRLERLSLYDTKITDKSIAHLKEMKQLTWLNIGLCGGLTKNGASELKAALPNCKMFTTDFYYKDK